MTKKELLNTYRSTIMELEELELQLDRIGTDGRPAGCRSFAADRERRGTNHPAAAASQLADGLARIARQKRDELADLSPRVHELITRINSSRTLMVVQHYYMMAETDEHIGQLLRMSTTRVNQLRNQYLNSAG